MYWRVSKESFSELDRDGRIWWGKGGDNVPRLKRFLSEIQEGVVPQTLWLHSEVGNTQKAKKEVLATVTEASDVFLTPKPTRLLERILQLGADTNSLILDSFAGSGTTAHAVLKANAQDGGSRRFLLVEMDENIAINITSQRISKAIEGYPGAEPLGGSFQYCMLGEPLFDGGGYIHPEVRFADLARHVWFTETGTALPNARVVKSPMLGVHNGVAYCLLFNGILGDRRVDSGNILTNPHLSMLPPHEGPRVIFDEGCRLSRQTLERLRITFKQIPYQVRGQ